LSEFSRVGAPTQNANRRSLRPERRRIPSGATSNEASPSRTVYPDRRALVPETVDNVRLHPMLVNILFHSPTSPTSVPGLKIGSASQNACSLREPATEPAMAHLTIVLLPPVTSSRFRRRNETAEGGNGGDVLAALTATGSSYGSTIMEDTVMK